MIVCSRCGGRHMRAECLTGADKPEFFWSPPDGAPIVGVTVFEGRMVVATGSGVYVVGGAPDDWTIHKISTAAKNG